MKWHYVILGTFWHLILHGTAALGGSASEEPLEGSCRAGDSSSPSCRPAEDTGSDIAGEHGRKQPTGVEAKMKAPSLEEAAAEASHIISSGKEIDVIDQEILELEEQVRISKEQIGLLEEMRSVISNPTIEVPKAQVKALHRGTPEVSHIAFDRDNLPSSSAEDYLISKMIIQEPEPIAFMKLLPLRNPRTLSQTASTQTTLPSALIVAVQTNGTVKLYTPAGELVANFSTAHKFPIAHMAVSPSHDEYYIATVCTNNVVRVHTVKVRNPRLAHNDKKKRRKPLATKTSQYLDLIPNVTVEFQKAFAYQKDRDGNRPRITSMITAAQRGTKYFLAGDAEGKVSLFTRNGTFLKRINVTKNAGGVEGLSMHTGSVVFRAGRDWGYIDLEKEETQRVTCPRKFRPTQIESAVVDTQKNERAIVTDENGTVWVLSRKMRHECKVEHRFPRSATQGPVSLASVRGFALVLEHSTPERNYSTMTALNMSALGSERPPKGQPWPSPVVWRHMRAPVREWSVYKRYQQGDLLAVLSEDGLTIEVLELLMTPIVPPEADWLGNFKLPVIAVAIVIGVGYQYWRQTDAS